MLYAIISEDVKDSLGKRQAARGAHIKRLKQMVEQDRVIVAGPHPIEDSEDPAEPGFSGSLIIAQFDSLEQARAWANDDPYVTAGVYKKVTVKPFKKLLP
ncbi:MAG: YciI family protein [Gammaproteobacteria bacterium]|nr:YciI family protein [Gammaproteobacteria bacterium]